MRTAPKTPARLVPNARYTFFRYLEGALETSLIRVRNFPETRVDLVSDYCKGHRRSTPSRFRFPSCFHYLLQRTPLRAPSSSLSSRAPVLSRSLSLDQQCSLRPRRFAQRRDVRLLLTGVGGEPAAALSCDSAAVSSASLPAQCCSHPPLDQRSKRGVMVTPRPTGSALTSYFAMPF